MSEVTFHLSNYTHYYTHISEETPKPTFWCEQSCCHISGRIPTKPGGLCVIIHLDQGKFCHLWFMMREMLTFLLLINVNSINVKTASPFLQRLSLIPLTDCFCPSLSLAQMGCVGADRSHSPFFTTLSWSCFSWLCNFPNDAAHVPQ